MHYRLQHFQITFVLSSVYGIRATHLKKKKKKKNKYVV